MQQQIQALMIHSALVRDLYALAVCEIALSGYPRTNTWEQLDTPDKLRLHAEYLLSTSPNRWHREKAELVCARQVISAGPINITGLAP